jgi:hypothetical protein
MVVKINNKTIDLRQIKIISDIEIGDAPFYNLFFITFHDVSKYGGNEKYIGIYNKDILDSFKSMYTDEERVRYIQETNAKLFKSHQEFVAFWQNNKGTNIMEFKF